MDDANSNFDKSPKVQVELSKQESETSPCYVKSPNQQKKFEQNDETIRRNKEMEQILAFAKKQYSNDKANP